MNHSPYPILVDRRGHVGRITLDRPKSLNAVDPPMARAILATLDTWRDDPGIQIVLIDSSSPRAFCAGGDIKNIRAIIESEGPRKALAEMSVPYVTMLAIASYPKPVATVMDGITMGGGVGLGAHARHRIVTERSVLAMPETAIGLTPDAGGSWLLARAPGMHGLRLALTGGRISGAQAVALGFADHAIASDALADLFDTLSTEAPQSVDNLLSSFASAPAAPSLSNVINETYDFRNVSPFEGLPLLMARLETLAKNEDAHDWAAADLGILRGACPFSLHVTWLAWNALQGGVTREEAFAQETRLVGHLLNRPDFMEGVRARLIDKDNAPVWSPRSIGDVTRQAVLSCFNPDDAP
ncbi:enoyl-CoA hydratase/isomerase family protein [Acetobacter sacchari]|uniref:3-hydroxyisobutyryl-CoA hydrolase n=1 Tax=Acetobacter sacchari TaxID=2661687 RepID=A0ABS3LV55_9PROT|nr:enoyl-CoA hydratase/isomerase family protein [Acetobacter sacchari]MBO1359778.1 enoyl-CoA hydratase/isomerase family protein [Acetobacter sacchari]